MAKKDPDRVKKLLAQLKKAKADARSAVDAQRKLERDTLNLRDSRPGSFTSEAELNLRAPGMARVDSVRNARGKDIQFLQAMIRRAGQDQIDNTMYPKTRHYGKGGYVPQYGLGGFLKKIGRAALPIAGSLIGGPIGGSIGGAISSALAPKDKSAQQATQQIQDPSQGLPATQQSPVGLTEETLQGTMQSHIEQMHSRTTDARASLGGGFRFGGRLPMRTGGAMKRLGGTAVEFNGPSHENGGIRLSNNAEVEGGETMDFVAGKGGSVSRKGVPYIFSDVVKVPGSTMSFAKYHKQMVKRGASPDQISSLADRQERSTGRGNSATEEYAFGGFLQGAGRFLGKHGGDILGTAATLAPSLLNIGQGLFGKTDAPVMQQIQAEQIEGPSRSDFGPTSRSGLDELGTFNPVRLNTKEAFARNASALRTASQGMGTAGRLAALAQARRGNLELQSNINQQETMFNAQRQDALQGRRASLAGQYDLADASQGSRFSQLLQQTRQFNAGQRSGVNQFNAQVDFANQTGKMQAQGAKANMLNAGITGLSQFAQNRANLGAQREGNQTALQAALAGADPATAARIQRILGNG